MRYVKQTAAACLSLLMLGLVGTAQSDEVHKSDAWQILQGGKLYDNWAKVTNFNATNLETNSLYPSTSKKSGKDTWRCKECHGWDYRGGDGAYSKGSHFTGIKGVRKLVGKSTGRIAEAIRGNGHGFTEALLSDESVNQLAMFISKGQIAMNAYITSGKKVSGSASRGTAFYEGICANCHGFDGKLMNFKTADNPEFLGTVAQANPWETLHKLRNGQPASIMPALSMLDRQDQLDILAYTQTLPAK